MREGTHVVISRRRQPRTTAERFRHPARVVAAGFGSAIGIGTVLLLLPVATESGQGAGLVDAVFTATSAVCVTGLITVDTGGHWSTFGEVVILALIQTGGLGLMTLAALFTVLVARRLGLRRRLLAQAETKAQGLSGMGRVVRNIVLFSLASEAVVAVVLTVRFATGYARPPDEALYHGVFHAISAFNNAGFSLNSDSLIGYATDPWVSLTVAVAVIVGGLGFPVVFELARRWRKPSTWSVLTRLTVWLTAALLLVGMVVTVAVERSNPDTLAPLSGPGKLLAGFFHSAMARTAGFNSVDTSAMRPESLFATDLLMFIGGGSAGTAGGIKVTTFGLLAFVIWSEMRGETQVSVGRRRVPEANQRQALAVALLGIGAVAISVFTLLALTQHTLDRVLFEAISAFGTVGLSAGITPDLPAAAKILLIMLMFVGRVGPLTLASALALRQRTRRFEYPEERTIVG
ncbi:TrkH family potassium uptake protein [Actinophytocola sp.]|uniref:TrkH family potassium uptake protein n=1 Tax=Actinophytocola sp. TaxID=1872138 RepID=UPI003D6B36E6